MNEKRVVKIPVADGKKHVILVFRLENDEWVLKVNHEVMGDLKLFFEITE